MAACPIPLDEMDPSEWEVSAEIRGRLERLFNHLEALTAQCQALQAENEQLKARLAKLEGQSPPPKTKPGRKGAATGKPNGRDKSGGGRKDEEDKPKRKDSIRIDREQKVQLNRSGLPDDFQSQGYRDVVVQNIVFRTDNVRYRLERGYSPGTGKFYEATLPDGLSPGYGPELEAMVLMLYYELRVPQPKIHALLTDHGVVISRGQISEILTKKHIDRFAAERKSILAAGLLATDFQQIDDTGMRVNGKNQYVTTLCSPFFSCFFTNPRKNWDTTAQLLAELDEHATLDDWGFILVADDASQFHNQTEHLALCWIHEERHYGKLRPFFKKHQKLLEEFRGRIWDYYDQLKAYTQRPTKKAKKRLSKQFDELFSTTTGYDDLDHRIELSRAKKKRLLLVLEFPFVPLENNESERTLREWVIKRKISGGTRSLAGTKAWDVFLSLAGTCHKQGIQFYRYLIDVIRDRRLGLLAKSILERAGFQDHDAIRNIELLSSA